jgi:hypothetical protein
LSRTWSFSYSYVENATISIPPELEFQCLSLLHLAITIVEILHNPRIQKRKLSRMRNFLDGHIS